MTAEQIAEAQSLAREWDAAHPREPPSPFNRLAHRARLRCRICDDSGKTETQDKTEQP